MIMDTGRLITRRTVMSATCVATVAAMMSPAPTAEAKADLARPRV
ncbi:MAG: Tat (twin-arginine translocation) pathway signal sequence, partial [Propionibacteriaceae bacterium]|nr:Tat (twin-arginine translocation) pathway signal sequence [Propionibacteriaceae bacterium]